jgi:solute carrier family 25 (mitochondrial S-adenosylmethionine transporter), member 26
MILFRIPSSRFLRACPQSACLVRVPTEIIKQRMQTGMYSTIQEAIVGVRGSQGLFAFYRGYWSMIAREIPFSFIQFPLWEGLKVSAACI